MSKRELTADFLRELNAPLDNYAEEQSGSVSILKALAARLEERRDSDDAPVRYSNEEANAWSSGWAAAMDYMNGEG